MGLRFGWVRDGVRCVTCSYHVLVSSHPWEGGAEEEEEVVRGGRRCLGRSQHPSTVREVGGKPVCAHLSVSAMHPHPLSPPTPATPSNGAADGHSPPRKRTARGGGDDDGSVDAHRRSTCSSRRGTVERRSRRTVGSTYNGVYNVRFSAPYECVHHTVYSVGGSIARGGEARLKTAFAERTRAL